MQREQFTMSQGGHATLTPYLLTPYNDEDIRPAIIICPGGSYLYCSDREGEPIAKYFNALGYHAFVLDYTTYATDREEAKVLPDQLEPKEETLFPTSLRELAEAMLLVKEHASVWHIDPSKVGVAGFSAGGNLAANYATQWHQPVVTDVFPNVEVEELRPRVAILGYPVTDMVAMQEIVNQLSMIPEAGVAWGQMAVSLFGSEKPDEAALAAASPSHHVSVNTPPIFIWSTREDMVVPVNQTTAFTNVLAENLVPFESHIYAEGPHGLSLATTATAGSQEQYRPEVATWGVHCGIWLEKQFAQDEIQRIDLSVFGL